MASGTTYAYAKVASLLKNHISQQVLQAYFVRKAFVAKLWNIHYKFCKRYELCIVVAVYIERLPTHSYNEGHKKLEDC